VRTPEGRLIDTGATLTYQNGPNILQPADTLNLHPGPNAKRSVVRWTVQAAGTYTVSGRFQGLDTNGTTTDVAVSKNGANIFTGSVIGYGSQTPFSLTVTVTAGDTIEFSVGVGSNGTYNSDSTGLAATITAAGAGSDVRWFVTDQLGTPRMVVDKTGSLSGIKRHDYFPFGEEIDSGIGGRTTNYGYSSNDNIRQKYAGSERDNETGLSYMKARHYSSISGRFTSVDPSGKSVIPTVPQTWNRYAYCYNNPLALVDKNGKWPTGTHDLIIATAFNTLNQHAVQQIQRGSAAVDGDPRGLDLRKFARENTLYERFAPHHAMTPGYLVKELGLEGAVREAKRQASIFINLKMDEAKAHYNASQDANNIFAAGLQLNKALRSFGEGAHTIMDGSSPAHRDFQVYDTSEVGDNRIVFGSGFQRFLCGMIEHSEKESDQPTDEEMTQMVDLLRLRLRIAFGDEMYNQAVSKEEREKTEQRLRNRR
jgi:RHS repeat-associated protein